MTIVEFWKVDSFMLAVMAFVVMADAHTNVYAQERKLESWPMWLWPMPIRMSMHRRRGCSIQAQSMTDLIFLMATSKDLYGSYGLCNYGLYSYCLNSYGPHRA